MVTKYDIGDIVLVPATVKRINVSESGKVSYAARLYDDGIDYYFDESFIIGRSPEENQR